MIKGGKNSLSKYRANIFIFPVGAQGLAKGRCLETLITANSMCVVKEKAKTPPGCDKGKPTC